MRSIDSLTKTCETMLRKMIEEQANDEIRRQIRLLNMLNAMQTKQPKLQWLKNAKGLQ